MKTLNAIFLTTLVFLYAPMAEATPSEGEKLAELRSDVDVLESLLQKEREEARINRASLIQQRGELEMRLRQEEVRQKTIRALLKKRVSEQDVAKDWEAGLSEP
ncbi:hypothetical protein KAI87_11045, partial [Myxococcota bacterium]|nr:hypothetical protein [Myxococcota bacterium]